MATAFWTAAAIAASLAVICWAAGGRPWLTWTEGKRRFVTPYLTSINGKIRGNFDIGYAVRTEVRPLEVHLVDSLAKLFILDTLISGLKDEVSPPLFEGFCFGYDFEDLGFQFLFCREEGVPEVVANATTLEEVCERWFVFSDVHYPVDISNRPPEEGGL